MVNTNYGTFPQPGQERLAESERQQQNDYSAQLCSWFSTFIFEQVLSTHRPYVYKGENNDWGERSTTLGSTTYYVRNIRRYPDGPSAVEHQPVVSYRYTTIHQSRQFLRKKQRRRKTYKVNASGSVREKVTGFDGRFLILGWSSPRWSHNFKLASSSSRQPSDRTVVDHGPRPCGDKITIW